MTQPTLIEQQEKMPEQPAVGIDWELSDETKSIIREIDANIAAAWRAALRGEI